MKEESELGEAKETSEINIDIVRNAAGIWRWIVLIMTCILLSGNYYSYDIPGAINTQLGEYLGVPYDEWQVQMNSLYTAYSLPNLIMPLIGGVLIDSVGVTRMLIIFSLLTLIGQVLFTFGISVKLFWLMALGRAVFGVGGESLEVAQASITTQWFEGSYLGLALGLNLTSARFASALNDFISPMFKSPINAGWIGVLICCLGLMSALFLSFVNSCSRLDCSSLHVKHADMSIVDEESIASEQKSIISTGLDMSESDSYDETVETRALLTYDEDDDDGDDDVTRIKFTNVLNLPLPFWLLCLGTMTLYGAVNPFIHILSDFLQRKWFPNDPQSAGALMSIPDLISALGSPLGGYFIDAVSRKYIKYQRLRSCLIPVAGLIVMLVHYLMGFTMLNPVIALILLGLAYSIFGAALWPLIPHFVEDKSILGSAYGVSAVALNITLAIGPQIVAQLLNYGGYELVEKYFIGLSGFCTAIGVAIFVFDSPVRQ